MSSRSRCVESVGVTWLKACVRCIAEVHMQVNEIAWNKSGSHLTVTYEQAAFEVFRFPTLETVYTDSVATAVHGHSSLAWLNTMPW